MEPLTFKYEVAFSFLKEDEALATQLADLLSDRLPVFLYSRKQAEIAGTDGEQTFNAAFGRESRTVVVLYRARWGETPWTKIEETAIRNRAFDDGYDFVMFINLDESSLPKWLPKTQIWIGLERWGVTAAAAVIERRVQDAGGTVRVESIHDKAARLQRAAEFDTRRKAFLNSDSGVNAAKSEVVKLQEATSSRVGEIVEKTQFQLNYHAVPNGLEVCAPFGCVAFDFQLRYANTLSESKLETSLWTARPIRPGRYYIDSPTQLRSQSWEFELSRSEQIGWRKSAGNEFLTTDQLVDLWLGILMEHSIDAKQKHPR